MKRLALVALLALGACSAYIPSSRYSGTPMSVVANLDTARFAGKWYEVARFPVSFQDNCVGSTAEYALRSDGLLAVRNQCRDGSSTGALRQIEGTAEVVGPGQLELRLAGVPVVADYWVLSISPDYRTAVIGVPSRRAGWVLHRDADISREERDRATAVFERNGYDIAALQRVPQR